MHILLIYPPSGQLHESCPMGMQMLAAVLERNGHEISLLDSNAAKRKLESGEIIKTVQRIRPDVVGFTLLTPMVRSAYELALELKHCGFRLLAGGPHATLCPEEALGHGFDAVVLGEGEPAIGDAVRALLGQIPKDQVAGWVYNDPEKGPVYTQERKPLLDIDALSLPARHLVDASAYGGDEQPLLHSNIFTSRGCPARCSFCAGGLFGKQFRFRSAKNIIKEICHAYQSYGTRHFHFVDDAATVNRERMGELCEGLIELQLPITWSVMTRVDTIEESLLRLLSRAGCIQINYGVESGHSETLKRIHKPHTVDMVRRIVPLTAEYGIKPFVFFILGFPWETADDIQITFDFMRELAPHVECFHPAVASIIIPFPGTEIYDQYKEQHRFENWWLSDDRHYDHEGRDGYAYFQSKMFSRGDVLKADFFNYSDEVKDKIYEVFRFMYMHNLKRRKLVSRIALYSLFMLSAKANGISQHLERFIFSPLEKLERFALGR